jgi:hypothetical protein
MRNAKPLGKANGIGIVTVLYSFVKPDDSFNGKISRHTDFSSRFTIYIIRKELFNRSFLGGGLLLYSLLTRVLLTGHRSDKCVGSCKNINADYEAEESLDAKAAL